LPITFNPFFLFFAHLLLGVFYVPSEHFRGLELMSLAPPPSSTSAKSTSQLDNRLNHVAYLGVLRRRGVSWASWQDNLAVKRSLGVRIGRRVLPDDDTQLQDPEAIIRMLLGQVTVRRFNIS
jgi:hypothetical protein